MRRLSIFFICFIMFFNIPIISKAEEIRNYEVQMKQDLLVLMLSYPGNIVGIEKSTDKVYVVMKSGKKSYMMIKFKKVMKKN